MSSILDFNEQGKVKFISATPPTGWVNGAKVNDLLVDNVTGILYTCVVATALDQHWLGTDGILVELRLTNPIIATDHPNLVAMYTMDNISGSTLVDEAGDANLTITTPVSTIGVIGSALDPFEVYGDIPDLLTNEVTINFWVKSQVTSVTSTRIPLTLRAGSPDQLLTYYAGHTSQAALRGSWTITNDGYGTTVWRQSVLSPLTFDTFDMLTFVGSGSTATVYKNGTLVVSEDIGFTPTYNYNTIWVEGYFGGNNGQCEYDQFRMFNRALTQEEITTLYNEPPSILDADHPNVIRMYTMTNVVGDVIIDETGTSNAVATNGVFTEEGIDFVGNPQAGIPTTYVTLDNPVSFGINVPFAISFIMKTPASTDRYETIIGHSGASYYLRFRNNLMYLEVANVSSTTPISPELSPGTSNLPVNTQYHIVVQRSGSTITLYVNGTSVAVKTFISSGVVYDLIGASDFLSTDKPSRSLLRNYRIFNRALTQTEITTLYQEGTP